jgi:hypothetical protein
MSKHDPENETQERDRINPREKAMTLAALLSASPLSSYRDRMEKTTCL